MFNIFSLKKSINKKTLLNSNCNSSQDELESTIKKCKVHQLKNKRLRLVILVKY